MRLSLYVCCFGLFGSEKHPIAWELIWGINGCERAATPASCGDSHPETELRAVGTKNDISYTCATGKGLICFAISD